MKASGCYEDLFREYPKEVILNDGTGVTLRQLRDGDGACLHDMFARFSSDDIWFLNHDVSDPEKTASWIRHLDPSRVVSIVALLEGRIIANAALMRKRFGAKSHIGKVRIAVEPGFREKRLATWMLLELINLGMHMGLRTLVMRLASDRDQSIIRAVTRLGFEQGSLLRGYLRDRYGVPQDLVLMTKDLRQGFFDEK